jgi:hypothetical protein
MTSTAYALAITLRVSPLQTGVAMHDETIFTTCERCNRSFNLSNREVTLEDTTAFCPTVDSTRRSMRSRWNATAIKTALNARWTLFVGVPVQFFHVSNL